jgi:carbon storage regulator
MIGNNILLTVLDVKGKQVRLRIDAPKEIVVHRKEIFDRINLEPKPP